MPDNREKIDIIATRKAFVVNVLVHVEMIFV